MELCVDIRKKLSGFELNLNFETSEDVLGLLGASGSGKSMTLRCIAGIETPDYGQIVLNGRILFDSQKGINLPCRRRRIGYVFQNYALFPHLTVEENIGFGIGELRRKDQKAIIKEMVTMIKLEGLEKRYPSQLSGGQQQRVALARALATKPEALLLDEPFSALDDYLRNHMVRQLTETLGKFPGAAVFVSHNMEEVYRVCRNLVILSRGIIEGKGGTKEVFKAPPSLAAAQLTGCKNISPAIYISPFELKALDWGITLKTNIKLSQDIKYVGIRAHLIGAVSDETKDNVLRCWLNFANEAPSRITLYLFIEKENPGQRGHQIEWEITPQMWRFMKIQPQPWKLWIDPEDLIIV
ncbi:ABC-type sulfate/molybdate transport systems, ATPase component [Desulfosporosinus acidiphilus SJ4]|uniref:ABC-type sulfate/molybdate transport systems, ATPase component n=1 Tax=Desulfosporosinus acidiphilus (strain DSM 22704 / JCM 16185 / SJ4) TaxID=646529 RepID=I4DAR3_DESAJ|nr:sulfate/molybdate ABC transporter ATP-binding protein [Desulfosporosinus acidiphilus]AFM42887.1 ABC-type sulfate/molybdate transport systems, ATPase component [Desulfosporosinus acidiphilus SJ4]